MAARHLLRKIQDNLSGICDFWRGLIVSLRSSEWSMQMRVDVLSALGSQLEELVGRPFMEPMTRIEVLLIQC